MTDALPLISMATLKAIVWLPAKAEHYVQELTAFSLMVFLFLKKQYRI